METTTVSLSSPKFNFLQTYLELNSGNECPRNYHIWSALVLLSAAVHKRVYVEQGYFRTYPNLYVGLIGDMGSRKSTAKDIASKLFQLTFDHYPILASVQSREDIIRYMNQDDNTFKFVDRQGVEQTVHPLVGFINELKNFLSVDPGKMIEFLTDIYSTPRFKSSTLKRGLEDLENPCVSILACETPEWIVDKLKGKIISGGWSRRMVYVYETIRADPIPFPTPPNDFLEKSLMLRDHLIRVSQAIGEFRWDPDAKDFYAKWYTNMRRNMPDDKVMAGYYESKHDQLLKVAMDLQLAEDPTNLVLTKRNLMLGISFLDVLEVNMPKLSVAAGRNDLAGPTQAILELLNIKDGWIPEKSLKIAVQKDLSPIEVIQVLRSLQETDQIVIGDVDFPAPPKPGSTEPTVTKRRMVMTKKKHEQLVEANKKV